MGSGSLPVAWKSSESSHSAGAIRGLTSCVSFLSGMTFFHCLILVYGKSCFIYCMFSFVCWGMSGGTELSMLTPFWPEGEVTGEVLKWKHSVL